ncbi:MAG: hypothetical protein HRT57_08075, partial [Crocinitomicaceae bacterium]|nr:hypothetical protein [Crocinitomicaceae bacterium]
QDTLSVYFDFNSSSLTSTEVKKITDFKKSDYTSIEGMSAFCDTVGTSSYNNSLANKRLEAVLSLLESSSKNTTLNGEKEAENSSNYNAAQSRRVDIIYKKKNRPQHGKGLWF